MCYTQTLENILQQDVLSVKKIVLGHAGQVLLRQVRLYCGVFVFSFEGLCTVLVKSGKTGPIHCFYVQIAF